jgi:hypothetical protein
MAQGALARTLDVLQGGDGSATAIGDGRMWPVHADFIFRSNQGLD